jgi:putative ABC transport system substrate-binding protein
MLYRTITALLLIVLVVGPSAAAQKLVKPLHKIGFILSSGKPSSPLLEAFSLGLRNLGYVDGQNIVIERRYAEGNLERMAPFVHEFVRQKIDVIIGANNVVTRAAKEATKSIPIVMISTIDPVSAGYVESFTNPGGNITGLTSLVRDLSAKRVELFKELLPKLSRIGIFWDADGPGPAIARKNYEGAAREFKLECHSIALRGPKPDVPLAFQEAKAAHVDALIVVSNFLMEQASGQIFDIAKRYRLPTMVEDRRYVDAGGLISYGANIADLYRRAAGYVDKLLKGAKPNDLPVEEPNKFEIVINHKTAKELAVVIPPSLSVREDR